MFLTLYVVSVLVSDYKLDKDKYSVELAKMEDESKSVLDSMLNSALSITNRVNYSLSFRDPYIQLLSGGELSVKDRTTIIQELRSAYAWCGNTDIEEVVLFLDNSDIALSASGIVQLEEPFQHVSFPTAYIETTNISDLLGVETSRFTFSDSNIIYFIGFRYQGGNDRGVLCISFIVLVFYLQVTLFCQIEVKWRKKKRQLAVHLIRSLDYCCLSLLINGMDLIVLLSFRLLQD